MFWKGRVSVDSCATSDYGRPNSSSTETKMQIFENFSAPTKGTPGRPIYSPALY